MDDETVVRWRIVERHYFMQMNAKVICAAYHAESNLLVAGFSNGLFGLYELPDFNMIHTLRCAFNTLMDSGRNTNHSFVVYLRTILTL